MKRKLSTGLSTKLSTTLPGVKKAEGKEKHSPCNPYKEKGKGKEKDGVSYETLARPRARAHAHARAKLPATCSCREARESAKKIIANCFGSVDRDLRIWAFYCHHFDRIAIEERAFYYASCAKSGEVRNPVSAFQSWLKKSFGPSKTKKSQKGGAR